MTQKTVHKGGKTSEDSASIEQMIIVALEFSREFGR